MKVVVHEYYPYLNAIGDYFVEHNVEVLRVVNGRQGLAVLFEDEA